MYSDSTKTYGFIPSSKDETNEARSCKSSIYAKAMGVTSGYTATEDGNYEWWLRSTGDDANKAVAVDEYGLGLDYSVDSDSAGVRPALKLNISSSDLYSYAGTVCSDGTVQE